MNLQEPTRAQRIAGAVAQIEAGSMQEKTKAVALLGDLVAREDMVRAACWSKSARLRAAGALALGKFCIRTDRLRLEQLAGDPNSFVRSAACQGLGLGNFMDSHGLLIAIAEDARENHAVRCNALIAAARLVGGQDEAHAPDSAKDRSQREVLALAKALSAQRVLRFDGYARALGSLCCQGAGEVLEDLADAALLKGLPDPKDASLLLSALGRRPLTARGARIMAQALDSLPGGRTEAARALGQWPSELARDALERMLGDVNQRLVALSAAALCALGLGPSRALVQRRLDIDDTTAATIIRNLHGPESFEVFQRIALKGKTGLRGLALKRMHGLQTHQVQALQVATSLVSDNNPQVRYSALELLIKFSGQPLAWQAAARADRTPWVACLGAPDAVTSA